jgi:hypothetical protein
MSRSSQAACLSEQALHEGNSFLIKTLHSRVMNYIAQIDFNEKPSFFHKSGELKKREARKRKRKRAVNGGAACLHFFV